jgi:HK97 gp10 family phage protein
MAQVTGVDKVKRMLVSKLPAQIRVELERSMFLNAQLIAAGARLRAPVGETGNVHDSIHVSRVKVNKRGGLSISVSAGNATTTTPAHYQVARMLEFGTVDMPAQPFMLPAYRANKKRARSSMRKAIQRAIQKVNT